MQGWIREHQENAKKLSAYLVKNYQYADRGIGLAGFMANAKARINTIFKTEALDILHEAKEIYPKMLQSL